MKKKLLWILLLVLLVALAALYMIFIGWNFPADATAVAALASDETVQVRETDYGWHFDGPSDERALIFYPGGKVEATAYAPLLHQLASEGLDACLVQMPLRLSFFGADRASTVMAEHDYPHWYIGGHSLGGVSAGTYASTHSDMLDGVILLASYVSKPLGDGLDVLMIRGSTDGVLNMKRYEASMSLVPASTVEVVIEGGNHAQFGSYTLKQTDGSPSISGEEQMRQTVRAILDFLPSGES